MTTISEVNQEVSDIINRGTTFDGEINDWTRRAVRWLERNYTFEYMLQFITSLDIATASRVILISRITGADELKRIYWMRRLDDDDGDGLGDYVYIEEVEPFEPVTIEEGAPENFWKNGQTSLVLVESPDKAYNDVEVRWAEFTTWPSTVTNGVPLISTNDDLVVAQTLILMAPRVRMDSEMLARWIKIRDEALNTVIGTEIELKAGAKRPQMKYG